MISFITRMGFKSENYGDRTSIPGSIRQTEGGRGYKGRRGRPPSGRLGVDPAVASNVFVTACYRYLWILFFSGNSHSILEVFLNCAIQRIIQEVKIPDLLSPCPTGIRLGEWLGKNKRHLLLRQATVRA